MKETWREIIQDKVGLICFMENPDPNGKPIIAGLNMTYISEKDEDIPEVIITTLKNLNLSSIFLGQR